MKTKTIEKVFDVNKLYPSCKAKIQTQFSLNLDEEDSQNSADGNSFTIIGVNLKENTAIIRISSDELTKRTYLSIVAIPTEKLSESSEDQGEGMVKDLSKKVLNATIKSLKGGFVDFTPLFVDLGIKGVKKLYTKYKLSKFEKDILNSIMEIFYDLGYTEKLFPFPFSVTNIDGETALWEEAYRPYLNSIENRLSADMSLVTEKYRDYDFAAPAEDERKIDLVVLNESDEEEHKLDITFVCSNKTLYPLGIREIVSLSEEVGAFTNEYRQKFGDNYDVIEPHLVFLSLFGYEENVGSFLRENIYREKEGVVPIFIAPPVQEEQKGFKAGFSKLKAAVSGDEELVWNNFKITDFNLIDKVEKAKRSVAKAFTPRGLGKSQKKLRKEATENLEEIKEKERRALNDPEFLEKWKNILQIDISADLVGGDSVKQRIQNSIAL